MRRKRLALKTAGSGRARATGKLGDKAVSEDREGAWLWLLLVAGPGRTGEEGEGCTLTSRADRHISGSSPPPRAWISLSFCQKLSGSLVVKTGPNAGQGERKAR